MNSQEIQARILTPYHSVFSGCVELISVPGAQGEMTLLPGHAPMIALLGPGTVSVVQNGSQLSYRIPGGLIEAHHESVTILAHTADRVPPPSS